MGGTITGLAYFYMVAAWGGYVFVINLIGCHAGVLVLLGRFSTKLHRAYSAFYIVGTSLAIQVPVVGWAPIKSLEQLGPLAVFVGFQLLEFAEREKRKRGLTKIQLWKLRVYIFAAAGVVGGVIVYFLAPTGYFGPISSRVRGLFVKHTKTGNPLVDSVAEHQAASKEAYFQYLNVICYLAPIGFGVVALIGCTPASSFLIVYGLASYFFSLKMVRLILLAAPIASICAGIFLGYFWAWSIGGIFGEARPSLNFLLKEADSTESSPLAIENDLFSDDTATLNDTKKNGKSKKKKAQKKKNMAAKSTNSKSCDPLWVRAVRLAVGVYFVQQSIPKVNDFKAMCHQIAKQISHPTIITKGQNRQTGETVVVDDYREAYFWLRDKTPEDARILSWWDYGYQITGIGNRTTIADGNTWNHEHIALLGRILTGPEKDAHRIARHLADYVLVWAGGGGDDLAKSPHLKRIANSVYRG